MTQGHESEEWTELSSSRLYSNTTHWTLHWMRWTDTLSKTGEQVIFYACGQAICITGDEQVFYSKWISNRWYIATEGEQVISYNRWLSTCLSIFTQAVQQVKQNCVQVLSSSLMLTILVLSRLNTLSTARIAELWKLSISSSHPTGQPSVLRDKYLLTSWTCLLVALWGFWGVNNHWYVCIFYLLCTQ